MMMMMMMRCLKKVVVVVVVVVVVNSVHDDFDYEQGRQQYDDDMKVEIESKVKSGAVAVASCWFSS